jgi:hypothetical protein
MAAADGSHACGCDWTGSLAVPAVSQCTVVSPLTLEVVGREGMLFSFSSLLFFPPFLW